MTGRDEARPALSIIVPTRDRPQMLERCLKSLRAAMGPDDELIAVDSASRDASRVAQVAYDAGAVLVRCDLPGVNRARNAGWRAARHHLLAYCDDDVIVSDDWAHCFARAAWFYPQAAFITSRLVAHTNDGVNHGNVALKDDEEPAVLTRDTRGDLGHGASVLVQGYALDAVGGWDEAMGVGGRFKSSPETDLYDRLFKAGFTGRYEPTVIAQHDQWRDSRALIKLDWRYGYGNGARIAKLVRTDRPRAKHVATEAVWSWGLQRLPAPIKDRNKTETARIVARMTATAVGFSRALFAPVRNGHFTSPSP